MSGTYNDFLNAHSFTRNLFQIPNTNIFCQDGNFNSGRPVNIFVNGMYNSLDDAIANLGYLWNENSNNCLVYNQTDGYIQDPINAARQFLGLNSMTQEPSFFDLSNFLDFLGDDNASDVNLNCHSQGSEICRDALYYSKNTNPSIFKNLQNYLTVNLFGAVTNDTPEGTKTNEYRNYGDIVANTFNPVFGNTFPLLQRRCDNDYNLFTWYGGGHGLSSYAYGMKSGSYSEPFFCGFQRTISSFLSSVVGKTSSFLSSAANKTSSFFSSIVDSVKNYFSSAKTYSIDDYVA